MLRSIWTRIPKTLVYGVAVTGLCALIVCAPFVYQDVSRRTCAEAGAADLFDRSFRVVRCGKPIAFLFASEARHGSSAYRRRLIRRTKPSDDEVIRTAK